MTRSTVAGLLAAAAAMHISSASAQSMSRGERLVLAHCGMCHATSGADPSPNPVALPLARIGAAGLRRVDESLRTGSLGGHPQMPRFEFSLRDADAVMQYLEGIQRP
jgi:mono/diheme cytochrome c family protein